MLGEHFNFGNVVVLFFRLSVGGVLLGVVFGFIVGATISSSHMHWWMAQPSLGSVSLASGFGPWEAVAVQLAVLAAIWGATFLFEPKNRPKAERGRISFLRGPWPLIWGAVGLAVLNVATLAIAGHPWSITFAFSLWGAKIAQFAGIPVETWPYWTWSFQGGALGRSVIYDNTSVMNVGLVLGAMLAAGLAGRFAARRAFPSIGSLSGAVIGGLCLGYGARLAFGCNIGALFSGIASGSLHGWLWMASALAGTFLGVPLARRALGTG